MKDKLLFYEKDEYYTFKELKINEGYSIISITEYIKDSSKINDFDSYNSILDISALSEYRNIQSIGEELLNLFDDDIIVISDKKNEELFKYELRFIFILFENIYLPPQFKEHSEINRNVGIQKGLKKYKKITDLDENELKIFFDKFRNSLYGHEKFKNDFFESVETFRVFNKIGEHRILSLFLMGESGVGKTEVAETIYKCFNGEKKLAKVNFGNYSSEFSLSSLIGSARGYIGSEDGEIFIRVRDSDVGLILIDEFEKSNAALFNYFLDVLESGKIISSLSEEIDLNGFIIIFTSNISKEDFKKRISPELRSRFDYKGQFTLLYNEDKQKYVEFRVEDIIKKFNLDYNSELTDNIKDYILSLIDVSKYSNMRDLNKKIKKVFVELIFSQKGYI